MGCDVRNPRHASLSVSFLGHKGLTSERRLFHLVRQPQRSYAALDEAATPLMGSEIPDEKLMDFAKAAGINPMSLQRLPGDASMRSYWRAPADGVLVMDDRHNLPAFAAFCRIASHLSRLGLRAPKVHAADEGSGLAVVEDFGDRVFASLLDADEPARPLYAAAIDVLRALHVHPDVTHVVVERQDAGRLLAELAPFFDWFLPAISGDDVQRSVRADLDAAWKIALADINKAPQTLVLRDFFAANLVSLGGDGALSCGLLDFQDALIGAPEYDLVSLLQDARRDLPSSLEKEMLERYFSGGMPDDAKSRYCVLGAQRHARILGIFIRLWQVEGRTNYLAHLGRVRRQLASALAHDALQPVSEAMERHFPGWTGATLPTGD